MNMTGERFMPQFQDPVVCYEHWHRYQFAGLFVADKKVLDIASGEGYGSSFLARRAKSVVGVDLSEESVRHASSKYVSGNLAFMVGKASEIPIAEDHSIDVIVSFETIEHVNEEEQRGFLAEVKRLLSPGGVFIVSTPNKLLYSDIPKFQNEFHVKEFYYSEFKDFLNGSFQNVAMLGQGVEAGSYINCVTTEPAGFRDFCIKHSDTGFSPAEEQRQALYFLAVCSDAPITDLPASFSMDLSHRLLSGGGKVAEPGQSWQSLLAQVTERERLVRSLTDQIAERDQSIESLKTQVADHDRFISHQVAERDQLIAEITSSKAWRLAMLLRKIRVSIIPPKTRRARMVRGLANTALMPYRKLKGVVSAGRWKTSAPSAKIAGTAKAKPASHQGAASPCLVDIDHVVPCSMSPGRIGIHLHLFHPDLASEFAGYMHNMPFPYDLYISVPDKHVRAVSTRTFSGLPLCQKVKIEIVPNRGRDMAPMFCTFGKDLMDYDFFAHLHSKKSGDNESFTIGWREYLCSNLFGSKHRIKQIFTLLTGHRAAGIVYPQTHGNMPCWANTWLANRSMGTQWCKRLGIDRVPRGYFDYPVGSMFWARCDALHPLFAANLTLEDFQKEAGQLDGTLAHCLERLPVLVARQEGFGHAVIKDADIPNWSPWRLDRYAAQTPQTVQNIFSNPNVRVVAFDIFDTLLCRPLLDPEAVKEIVARRATNHIGEQFRQFRSKAERIAREHTRKDVGLDNVYAEFAKISSLSPEETNSLHRLEEQVEWHSVAPRPDGVAMIQLARKAGKRVILVSDMFLPKAFLESMLKERGITDWDALYVSNDVGLRKDTGDLYGHVLDKEGLLPKQMLMVGDNERVDAQIPVGLGIANYHVLRPVEAARALPRLKPFVEKAEYDDDLDNQLALGLILRRVFSPIFHSEFDPAGLFPATPVTLGYSVVGPLVLGFVNWLVEQARRDGIDRLHFLAREGQSIKMVYDRWVEAFQDGPPSEYLVLSRRASTVPSISSHRDILSIARTNYSANTARCFLEERFGVELSKERWEELYEQTRWSPERKVEVWNGHIGGDVLQLLYAVQKDIFAQAAVERPALNAYLHKIGLDNAERSAIVDVGYSATVQDRVNLFLNKQIHGYYMMTVEKANAVRDRYGSIVRGCFAEGVSSGPGAPAICSNSFALEKMLGSNDGQIVRYILKSDGDVLAVHRPLSNLEREGNQARSDIRRGMLEYTEDAIKLRKNLFPDFRPPLLLPEELFVAFTSDLSPAENAVLQNLILDAYYCGKGLQ